jgi:hypothetical protein
VLLVQEGWRFLAPDFCGPDAEIKAYPSLIIPVDGGPSGFFICRGSLPQTAKKAGC